MTQFRPGQRVRVVGHNREDRRAMPIGTVCEINRHGSPIDPIRGSLWSINTKVSVHQFEPLPGFSGIDAHLSPTPRTDAMRHWPVWTR